MNEDEKWIQLTFDLAKKGISGASPNPLVGCVIVKNNRVVGQGTHANFGGPHAEIVALKKSGENAKGGALYTNLEPCCHWGKTPPCTRAIIQAGIRKVISSLPDPNPLVRNKGFKELKLAGIQVETGLFQPEAKDLNRYFIKYMTQKKPYVILKSAMSLDGKIATSLKNSQWISSKASRNFSHTLRTEMDGILVGANTVRQDNPSLTSHGKGRNPVRMVLTKTGELPKDLKIFNSSAPTWIFHSSPSLAKRKKIVEKNIEWIYLKSQNGNITFHEFLKECAKREISKLLIEGGGITSTIALEENEVDEILFFIAPILIGGKDAITVFDGKGFQRIKESLRLKKMETKKIGCDLMISARIKPKNSVGFKNSTSQ
ncbi:MAG: riboflavin biosynthesis protein RibD [Elusimicrobia bacterium RIFCSPLOWO2_02_FULL_39_32]|nr:MAG: riboflavin biosynthesis protein RibD [Elusimicrobia bacterium GWA2_38_7]OGR79450.1 MAG: riboflavin biosynthesis protein RibD [Elusimicrobia bacterium RIFCSPHIGHO2_02_FULL_39_36]OGR92777.1 MAG: riboflavin biosynthesis protein RibD [Elusimicrobia bacterium RIFCSPLOWO2_02_FULL_39_32]OGR99562.1 MAG: riboflavin biosynthesis protein RibD [Elusimicrobia bacterium RIFCSPLOWO2_12_FULL_39_28]